MENVKEDLKALVFSSRFSVSYEKSPGCSIFKTGIRMSKCDLKSIKDTIYFKVLQIVFLFGFNIHTQTCCYAATCSPISKIIGDTIYVGSTSALRAAINQINDAGGSKSILIADGEYILDRMLYITGSNVVIRSKKGARENVVLKGNGMQGNVHHVFLVSGSNVTIADISLGEVANHAIQITGEYGTHDVTIHNVHIFNTGQQMIKSSIGNNSDTGAANCVVQCSLGEYTATLGPQYYIGGIDVHGGINWIVRDNIFKNIRSPEYRTAEHAIHFWNNSKKTLVERNIIVNCDRGIGFGLGNYGHQDGVIRNNMISNNGAGLVDDVGIGLENATNAQVYHNSIFMEQEYPNAIEYRFSGTEGTRIYNNLSNKRITMRDDGLADVRNNITDAQRNWFVNPDDGDLHLNFEVSSVVDRGLVLSEASSDFDNNIRPNGNGYDIGADEYLKCLSDTDSDGDSDGEDLAANSKLVSEDNCLAEITGDYGH